MQEERCISKAVTRRKVYKKKVSEECLKKVIEKKLIEKLWQEKMLIKKVNQGHIRIIISIIFESSENIFIGERGYTEVTEEKKIEKEKMHLNKEMQNHLQSPVSQNSK